jgi:hypothetical protein
VNRLLGLTIGCAATVASMAGPSFAQTWPATVVASSPRMIVPSNASTSTALRALQRHAARPRQEQTARPLVTTLMAAASTPKIELRPKDVWVDDQGLRVAPSRIAYKQRF